MFASQESVDKERFVDVNDERMSLRDFGNTVSITKNISRNEVLSQNH
jgi:hypothetical protein